MSLTDAAVRSALLGAIGARSVRHSLARALGVTEGTLTMAAAALSGIGDPRERAALLAVAHRLYPGPYDSAAILGVPAGALALFGEALLTLMGRTLPAKAA